MQNDDTENLRSSDGSMRFEMWAGMGLPKGWAENMGLKGDDVGDVVWPIIDKEMCGPIDGFPRPDQMLCWCPSSEKQRQVFEMLNNYVGTPRWLFGKASISGRPVPTCSKCGWAINGDLAEHEVECWQA